MRSLSPLDIRSYLPWLRRSLLLGCALALATCTSTEVEETPVPEGPAIQVTEELVQTASDQFGYALAVSGHHAVVGRPMLGVAHVYAYRDGNWKEIAILTPDDGETTDQFGAAVAITDKRIAIGAPAHQQHRGAVYLFARQGEQWRQVHRYLASRPTLNAQFGHALSLSTDHLLVGAPGDDEMGIDAGAAYIFHHETDNSTASEGQKLLASDAQAGDFLGASVSLSGSHAVLGAPHHDHDKGRETDSGAAYVWARQQETWVEISMLQARPPTAMDLFGSSVAISNNHLIIGAPHRQNQGAVYVFHHQGGLWLPAEPPILPVSSQSPDTQFGAAVALVETIALVGAPAHHATAPHHIGAAYLFQRQAGHWVEISAFSASTTQSPSRFGYAVALSPSHAWIGAPALSGETDGQAYTYRGWQPNTPPIITSTPLLTATRGTVYRYQVRATDPDHHPLTYSLLSAPLNLSIHPTTGLMVWTPTVSGHHLVYLEVHDHHGAATTQQYGITVSDPSSPQPPETPKTPETPETPEAPKTPEPVTPIAEVSSPPTITSIPITQTELLQLIPQIRVVDANLHHHTIRLNGKPYTPGTPITTPGQYTLTVEAIDVAGNTARTTLHFSVEETPVPQENKE